MNVIKLDQRKADTSSHRFQLRRSIADLEQSIKTAEQALRATDLKVLRKAVNQLKNTKYILEKQLKTLGE